MRYTCRMKSRRTFKYLLSKGSISKGKYVIVYFSSNHKKCNYFGICVSKKNGNSVARNKLKRWAREIYTHEENKLKKGFNIIIFYKKDVTTSKLNFLNLEEDIKNAFRGTNLYE